MSTVTPELDARVDLGRGLVLANPVGVASGTFGFGFEAEAMAGIAHLGAIFSKGTTALPREGNRPPRIAETAAGMLNSIGLQNPGVEVVARDYAPRWAGWPVPVLVNVAGADLAEYVEVVQRLDGVEGVAGVELNISCPNIAHGLDFATEPGAAARCVAAVRAATTLPLVVKLSPNVTEIAEVARAVEDAGADALWQ
jgi:dihydroorotate dehydrogenase (NAD+) catalytic subunit